MSLPTPTGNPTPFAPGHVLYDGKANVDWIAREARPGETPTDTVVRLEKQLRAWQEKSCNRP